MTLTQITEEPASPSSHPKMINAFIRSELHLILDALINTTDPDQHSYLAGVYIGYSVALGWLDRAEIEEARRAPFASTLPLEVALLPIGQAHVESARLRACGVLWGWREATRFEEQADECQACGARIMCDTDDFDYCLRDQIRLCEGGCLADWHGDRSCPECDS